MSSINTPLIERTELEIRDTLKNRSQFVQDTFVALWRYACLPENRIGYTPLGHRCRIPGGTLSSIYNNKYTGDYDAIAERVEHFFHGVALTKKYGHIHNFVETNLTRYLGDVFDRTRTIRRIQLIESPEQIGKTWAAKEYTRANNHGRTVYVEISGSDGTLIDFLNGFGYALGVPYSIKRGERVVRIREVLAACDLVIIDEVHQAFKWANRELTKFWDYVRTDLHGSGKRGVVMIATNCNMLQNIEKFRISSGYNTGQLIGRMRNNVIRLDPIGDIVEEDIAAFARPYYTPSDDTVKLLTELARCAGHIALLKDCLDQAWDTADRKGQPMTDKLVLSTARQMLAELRKAKG